MELDDRITIATPEGVAIEMVLAGLGSRFLARLLDSVIQFAVIVALSLGVSAVGTPGVAVAVVLVIVFLVARGLVGQRPLRRR